MYRRRRMNGANSVGNKITEKDSDTLAVYLLNFAEKYTFSDEVLDLLFYILKAKKRKDILEKLFSPEIKKLFMQKKLHFTPSAKKSILENMKEEKNLAAFFENHDKKIEPASVPVNPEENSQNEDESLLDFYLSHRSEFFSGMENSFREDSDIFNDVYFNITNPFYEDFARVLILSGEKIAKNIMCLAIFHRDDGKEISLEKKASIPSRAMKNFSDFSKIQLVIDFASLNETESALLKFFYFQKKFSVFAEINNHVNSENWPQFYSTVLGISESEIVASLRKDKPLLFYGLVVRNVRTDLFELGDDVSSCISVGDMSAFFTSVLRETEVKPYPLESFSCKESDSKIILNLLKGGQNVNILLYGAAGSGKTEFAKSVIKAAGKKVLLFKNDLELDNNENAICALNRISAVSQGNDFVIVVDEADKILSTGETMTMFGKMSSEQKGPINKMLEESKNQIIWITNYINQMDESTKRRFTFSLEFNPMPEETLRTITKSRLSDIQMNENDRNEILDLCSKYKITGASVDNVRKMILSLKSSDSNESREEKLAEIKSVLASNSALLNGKAKMREKQCKTYDMSVLNTSMDAEKIVKMISNAERFSEKNKTTENGIRILFYGASGTGKTEFARYIADKLGKKILLKRASDILSKFVGESEQNIALAFRQAENSGEILLFDEADSFFYSRESADHSWERTGVNEFLTQMEEFSGILICTTNLKEILDPAVNRRFHLLCEFKPLSKDGIKKLLEKYFSSVDFSESQISKLAQSNSATPGDFGALASRLRFMDEDEQTAENITEELLKMQRQKRNSDSYEHRVGFSE